MEQAGEQVAAGAGDASVGPSSAALAAAGASAGLFRRKTRAGNLRKRGGEDQAGSGDEGDEGGVVRKAKQLKGEPLAFTTKRDDKDDLALKYEGSKAIQDGKDNLATRTLETETDFTQDARAIREKILKQAVEGTQEDGQYKGQAAYIDYRAGFRREHTVGSEKGTGSHGPLRGSAYMRVTARFDYQPDLCKDYKETGFCSYGDSCKFMHDRGDYKSGWELDKMWEEEQKKKADALAKGWNPDAGSDEEEGAGAEEPEDDLPFACFICRREWAEAKHPVVTKCKHYFCEACALKHNAKSSKCAVCGQATNGIFNVANDVLKRMKRKQEQDA